MKQEVTVRIFNRDYRLLTDESKEYTADLASVLNRRLDELMSGKSTLTPQDGAALIALEACDDLFKTRSNLENIRSQIKNYFDDAADSKARAEAAEQECARLKASAEKETAELMESYEKQIAALKAESNKKIAELTAKAEQLQKEVDLRKSFVTEDNATAKDMMAQDISKALGGNPAPRYKFKK